jgi:hypothetical protein
MEVNDLQEKTTDLTDHLEDLVQTMYNLSVVRITKKISTLSAGLVITLGAVVLSLFILFFAGMSFAWWMGDVVNSRAGGFLIGAGFFIILLCIIIGLRKKLLFPHIRNLIIRKVYDKVN